MNLSIANQVLSVLLVGLFAWAAPAAAEVNANSTATSATFASFDDAVIAARKARDAGDLKVSRDAFEAALPMAPDDRRKCDVHRVLIDVYAETGDIEKVFESMEYVLDHAPYPAMASLTLRSVLSIVQRKGLKNEFKARYEAKLEKNPKDRVALNVLESFTYLLVRDHRLRGEYLKRLIELDKEEGKPVDPKLVCDRAFSLRLSRETIESAKLYESIAGMDEGYQSYALMEAAQSWQSAGEDTKALDAAVRASDLGPDQRANQSLYHWHRGLADIFLAALDKSRAEKHYVAALATAGIDAYREQCEEKLALVRALKD